MLRKDPREKARTGLWVGFGLLGQRKIRHFIEREGKGKCSI